MEVVRRLGQQANKVEFWGRDSFRGLSPKFVVIIPADFGLRVVGLACIVGFDADAKAT